MAEEFVLDTNVYALIFQSNRSPAYFRLRDRLVVGDSLRFLLPEIVSMEIHSVIGKYRRGGAVRQEDTCTREVQSEAGVRPCAQRCVWPARAKMKDKVFRALQKLMADIEAKHGDIQAEVIPFGRSELEEARSFLSKFAHLHAFGSHDALVAATVKIARDSGRNLVLTTSDKGLKAVCGIAGIPIFDPNTE